jgi:adenylate kinase
MIIILTGAPGAGKGTQADLLASRCGYKKLSTGDALRKHVRLGTAVGKVAGAVMERGELVSDELLLDILNEELRSIAPDQVVLLDGYPRNLNQAKSLESLDSVHEVKAVVHLDVARAELVARLSGRRVCGSCGASFHVTENPPSAADTCDRCGGALTQRADDRAESVAVRLDVYDRTTTPVLDFYRGKGLYERVDGVGTLEDIYSRLKACLRSVSLAQ